MSEGVPSEDEKQFFPEHSHPLHLVLAEGTQVSNIIKGFTSGGSVFS